MAAEHPNLHTDLQIRIRAATEEGGAYPVEATLSDGSFFFGGHLQLSLDALQATSSVEEYGRLLAEALFQDPLGRAYDRAIGLAGANSDGRLRLRLWLDPNVPELHTLRWERLLHRFQGQELPLAISTRTPFSRYIGLEKEQALPLSQRPVRLLLAIANPPDLPSGLASLNVEMEVRNFAYALNSLSDTGRSIQVSVMAGRTGLSPELQAELLEWGYTFIPDATSLDNMLQHLPAHHLLHFIGHGRFSRRRRLTYLYLERATGEGWVAVQDDEILGRLTAIDPVPQLVFLSACETAAADPDETHAFIGLAPKLVQAGVPAVVAMQDLIPMLVAQRLTFGFYQSLHDHGVVDTALNQARQFLYEQGGTNWDIPVLYMRQDTGQLLTTDPVRVALEAMRDHPDFEDWFSDRTGSYIFLPIEVVHLAGEFNRSAYNNDANLNTAATDLVRTVRDLFAANTTAANGKPQLLTLLGDQGSNKSTQLRRLAWDSITRSLDPDSEQLVLPILIDLRTYHNTTDPLEMVVLRSLQRYWPDLTLSVLQELCQQGPILRFLFDGSDSLAPRHRLPIWQRLLDFMQRYPHHQYLIATDQTFFDATFFSNVTHLHSLVMQPLTARRINHFLDRMAGDEPDDPYRQLHQRLKQAQLYPLAAIPRFLVWLIQRAKLGELPESSRHFLEQMIGEAIAGVQSNSMRNHAHRLLCNLAWHMHEERRMIVTIDDAFAQMITVRGNREYNLEVFLQELIDLGLLTRFGENHIRFAYGPYQSYFTALYLARIPRKSLDDVLDDITATLGRLNRLYWWHDTLILLSSMLVEDILALQSLLRRIIYGVDLLSSDQTFLAAAILVELRQSLKQLPQHNPDVDTDLPVQVISALIWRLNSHNENRLNQRVQAARLLGQLYAEHERESFYRQQQDVAIETLVKIANQKVRIDSAGRPDFEFISMRMAALMALYQMGVSIAPQVEKIDPELVVMLGLWQAKDAANLIGKLYTADEGTQGVAALALGDILTEQNLDGNVDLSTSPVMQALLDMFYMSNAPYSAFWGVNFALAMQDAGFLTEQVILPFVQRELTAKGNLKNRPMRHFKSVSYLIGRLRVSNPVAREFLLTDVLYTFRNKGLLADVIEALGWLGSEADRGLLQEIAVGYFEQAPPARLLPYDEQLYLRRRAIESLARIGDLNTISRLRDSLNQQITAQDEGIAELRRAFYRTSEQIYWRLSYRDEIYSLTGIQPDSE